MENERNEKKNSNITTNIQKSLQFAVEMKTNTFGTISQKRQALNPKSVIYVSQSIFRKNSEQV